MDKTDPPLSFGVFKPVGHTVIAFRSAADLAAATRALQALGLAGDALVHYSPAEMVAQVEAERASASPLAVVLGHKWAGQMALLGAAAGKGRHPDAIGQLQSAQLERRK